MASPLGNFPGFMLNPLGIIRTWLSVIPASLCFGVLGMNDFFHSQMWLVAHVTVIPGEVHLRPWVETRHCKACWTKQIRDINKLMWVLTNNIGWWKAVPEEGGLLEVSFSSPNKHALGFTQKIQNTSCLVNSLFQNLHHLESWLFPFGGDEIC